MNLLQEYYEFLGLKLNASPEEVKQAYRNLVKIWHPDRFPHDSDEQLEAEKKFKQISQAYEALKDYQPGSTNFVVSEGIAVSKTDPTVYYQKGAIYAEQEKYQEAIADFSQAISLDPNYIKAYQYRAFILSKLGYENRANADFQKVTTLKLQQNTSKIKVSEPKKTANLPPQSSNIPQASPQWINLDEFLRHSQAVTTIAISQDGKIMASGSNDQTIKLWQLRTAQAITTIREKHKGAVIAIEVKNRT